MNIKEIVDYIKPVKVINSKDIEVTGICYNSKQAAEGDIFVCLTGEHTDGHVWAKDAYEKGVQVFMTEKELDIPAMQLVVDSTRMKIAPLAGVFYGFPSKTLNLIGVTGTNGKTTVTHLLQKIYEEDNQKCALIGTLGHKLSSSDTYHDAAHTTPQAPELQKVLHKLLTEKINNVAMEVSSHALEQNRVGECDYKGAILTNLTQDHLDYHITMENYFKAKALLFSRLKPGNWAVINLDDAYAEKFISVIPDGVKCYTYSTKNPKADFLAKDINFDITGASFVCVNRGSEYEIKLHSNGIFSVYNALAALAGASAGGIDLSVAKSALEKTPGVAGRFETVIREPLVIVDYAHTPDGLENVLKAARTITPKESNLICLFGCGGDRDATKRPKMGNIAGKLADKVVVTSDNPRSENPDLIISDIMAGFEKMDADRIFVEPDRQLAIKFIAKIADKKDVVIIAGKGHEDYQILKDRTIHFNDKEEVLKAFSAVTSGKE